MSVAAFTQGPWEIIRSATYKSCWIEDESGRSIVDLYHYKLEESSPENPILFIKENAESNARLIVAAPDLYSAVKSLISPFDGFNHNQLKRHLDPVMFTRIIAARLVLKTIDGKTS